jgi:hypothetical protein
LLSKASSIEDAKRPAYTGGNPDCLHNFKTVAARLGISPLQAWGVYFLKHIDAITSLAKDETLPQAEAIEGRFADAINYLKLGFALFTEGGRQQTYVDESGRKFDKFGREIKSDE